MKKLTLIFFYLFLKQLKNDSKVDSKMDCTCPNPNTSSVCCGSSRGACHARASRHSYVCAVPWMPMLVGSRLTWFVRAGWCARDSGVGKERQYRQRRIRPPARELHYELPRCHRLSPPIFVMGINSTTHESQLPVEVYLFRPCLVSRRTKSLAWHASSELSVLLAHSCAL
jgi:hypothetical protein